MGNGAKLKALLSAKSILVVKRKKVAKEVNSKLQFKWLKRLSLRLEILTVMMMLSSVRKRSRKVTAPTRKETKSRDSKVKKRRNSRILTKKKMNLLPKKQNSLHLKKKWPRKLRKRRK